MFGPLRYGRPRLWSSLWLSEFGRFLSLSRGPAAAAIAQSNANAQNAEMISATIERGQANMAMLERAVIKDNTLLPGEWYGGQLHIAPLVSQDGPKSYTIVVTVGPDRHEIRIAQEAVSS